MGKVRDSRKFDKKIDSLNENCESLLNKLEKLGLIKIDACCGLGDVIYYLQDMVKFIDKCPEIVNRAIPIVEKIKGFLSNSETNKKFIDKIFYLSSIEMKGEILHMASENPNGKDIYEKLSIKILNLVNEILGHIDLIWNVKLAEDYKRLFDKYLSNLHTMDNPKDIIVYILNTIDNISDEERNEVCEFVEFASIFMSLKRLCRFATNEILLSKNMDCRKILDIITATSNGSFERHDFTEFDIYHYVREFVLRMTEIISSHIEARRTLK